MLSPDKVQPEAQRKEKENLKFRTYLKCHADEDTLDKQFQRLHRELFAEYDCGKCRNCCKMYCGTIPHSDLEQDAAYLHMTEEELVKTYLVKDEYGINYNTKTRPVISCRKTVPANWGTVNRRIVRSIPIQISRSVWSPCTVY